MLYGNYTPSSLAKTQTGFPQLRMHTDIITISYYYNIFNIQKGINAAALFCHYFQRVYYNKKNYRYYSV
jgi:hypothetical protein